MEIYVLGRFKENAYRITGVGVIDDATSISWRDKYYEPGNFEIHMPNTAHNRDLVLLAKNEDDDLLFMIPDSKQAGVVEYFHVVNTEITVKGRFYSSVLDRVVTHGIYSAKNIDCSQAVWELVSRRFGDRWEINTSTAEIQDTGKNVTFQATYKNLLNLVKKLARYSSFGFEAYPETGAGGAYQAYIKFRWYQGTDRTGSGTAPAVIFSESFENLQNIDYEFDKSALKNFEYVGGQGEGKDRVIVETGSNTDINYRKEKFYNASSEDKDDDDTDEEYQQKLQQIGNNDLEQYTVSKSYEFDAAQTEAYQYGRDYDVGDLVVVNLESWSVMENMRLTEACRVYEQGDKPKITLTFGSPLPESINWEDA